VQAEKGVRNRFGGISDDGKARPKLSARIEPDAPGDPVTAAQGVDCVFLAGDPRRSVAGAQECHAAGATQRLDVHSMKLLRIDRLGAQIENRGEQL
jgi:hypothetical protein